jgi:hypothetical protein
MATLRDVDALAVALPEVTKEVSDDGRPSYAVHGKAFCFHRPWRKDAPFDDVFVFRTDGPESKELLLADPRRIFFTTPHWNGYSAVLVHLPDMKQLSRSELRDLVVDAWLTRAPKRLAQPWLAANEPER